MSENRVLKAALEYAANGWAVLPIVANAKNPACEHGVKDATTDETQIRKWFEQKPNLNIGVATGQASGIVVVDIDPRNGGEQSFERLETELGKLPETPIQLTAGGGIHYLFKYQQDMKKRSLDAGIDFLGDGAYFVVSPSRIDDKAYEWEVSSDVSEVPIIDLPESWVKKINDTKRKKNSKANQPIIQGNRDDGLTAIAGELRRVGMSESAIFSALEITNIEQCEPPLPLSDIVRISKSISR